LVVAGILLCALACVLTLRVAMGVATTRDRRERAGASAREAAAAGRDARLAPVVAPAE
jgi:SEL1 protein